MAKIKSAIDSAIRHLPRFVFGADDEHYEIQPLTTYYMIIVPTVVLTIFGLMMGFSAQSVTSIAKGANPYMAYLRPSAIIVFALIIAFAVHKIPRHFFVRFAPYTFGLGLIVQAMVITPLGRSEGGNANWVYLPGVPVLVQPSEFLKLALIVFLAFILTGPNRDFSNWRQMSVLAGLPVVVTLIDVMLGHDLGTAMIVTAAAMGALWIAGLPKRWFGYAFVLAVPLLVFLVIQNPTRLRRILVVLPGFAPKRNLSAPEQIDHSLWAFGSGGVSGLGPGASREKWNYLQAAHTDFIFAIVGEEFGLLGTLAVLTALALLVWGMFRVVRSTSDPFVAIVAAGVATWIGFQALVNIASVTQLGPVIGVPLPLVSYGGSSFLFTALAIGVVASFARSDAGMTMWGYSDPATRRRDPRVTPKLRRAGGSKARK